MRKDEEMPLRTVGKVGRVLDLFSFERAEWGVREAAKELALPKSGAHALMSSLADQGLLRRTRAGRYRLGWRLTAMNQVLLETTDFRFEARRAMEYLASRFGGESFYLAVLEGGRVIFLDEIQDHRMTDVSATPDGLPIQESAVGRVLIADLPWEEVMRIVADDAMVGPEGLRDELRAVREQGYAFDPEEMSGETRHAAAPIRDRTGETVAAIGLAAPAYRFHQGRERYVTILVEASRGVSESIGYRQTKTARSRRVVRRGRPRLQKVG